MPRQMRGNSSAGGARGSAVATIPYVLMLSANSLRPLRLRFGQHEGQASNAATAPRWWSVRDGETARARVKRLADESLTK